MRFCCVVVATALLLAGCPTTPRRGGPPNVDRAEELMRAGDHAGAAALYERLATETTGSDSAEFRLRAARAWLAAGRAADADRVLAHAAAAASPSSRRSSRACCASSPRVAQGRGDEAWREVSSMQTPAAPPAAARYYETRQQVAIATGHLVDGIRSELARERLIGPGDARVARSELLGQLRAAAERGVSLAPPPGSDATVRGWLEAASVAAGQLAQSHARRHAPGGVPRALSRRIRRSPRCRANRASASPNRPRSSNPRRTSRSCCRSPGAPSAPAAQIRDGFMTAYYQVPADTRPRLRVYDTAVTSIADTVAQANAAGAEFIVGPLTREEVVAAAELLTTRPPMLALNFLPADRPTPERFFQFALSPEDDARAVARYIGASGRRRGVVLTPEGDWGTRVAAAFDEELRAAGGYVLGPGELQRAPSNDFSASIMQVLRTDDSRARQQRIQAAIGQKLEFEPRRRPDIQFIFAPSQPGAARQLRPQLRFHLAGDIPTYTLGDAYEPHPTANQEIDGVMFPDMPWMLGDDGLVRRSARSGAPGLRRFRREAAAGCSPSVTTPSASRRRCNAARPINPQGLTGTLSHRRAGPRPARARVGAHQERRADAARRDADSCGHAAARPHSS